MIDALLQLQPPPSVLNVEASLLLLLLLLLLMMMMNCLSVPHCHHC